MWCKYLQRDHALFSRFLYRVLSVISHPGKLPWNLKPYTVYRCRNHFREAWSLDCDVTIREKRWHGLVRGWNARVKVFLGKCKFKILGYGVWGMGTWSPTQADERGENILESAHLWYHPTTEDSAHITAGSVTAVEWTPERGADPEYCVLITLQILTKDSHPQADAIFDLLSTHPASEMIYIPSVTPRGMLLTPDAIFRIHTSLWCPLHSTYPSGVHSASAWQVPQTSTVWFYCRAVDYGCHISLEIVGRVTPKF